MSHNLRSTAIRWTFCFGLVSWLGVGPVAWAELPSPRLDLLRPNGLAAGGEVEVTINGPDLEGCERLICEHPGLTAEFIKDKTFRLRCAADVPVGTYDVYAVGRFGITNPRVLQVTHGLTDVAEVEPNNTLAAPQDVAINTAINGVSDGNNRDLFRFPLQAGQRITLDCFSARLETEMDPQLTLFNAQGQQVASNADYYGRDPVIEYIAAADGDYTVEVRDLTYRGGYPYRLWIHDRPRVENLFPRAVQSGQTVELTALGGNLGDGAQPSGLTINDVPQFQKRFTWTAPADIVLQGLFRHRVHPLQHSVLPTASTCTLVGTQILPFEADPCVLLLTDHQPVVEVEPNNHRDQAQRLTLPAIVSGKFDAPRDADWYLFETDAEGGLYGFDVYAERIDGRCDPYVAFYDDKGNRILELDDFGHRVGPFDGHLRDPSGQTNLQGGKQIHVLVQDRYQRGGPRNHYVLSIRKAETDLFAASIPHQQSAAGLNLWQGGAAYLELVFHHRDGGNQYPVTVTAEGLPPGVHVSPTSIPNNNRGNLVFWSDENAAEFTVPITLVATSQHGDRTLRRIVRPHTRAYQQTGSREMRQQMLAVREQAPYALRIEPERITATAGQPVEIRLIATRHWPKLDAQIDYQPLNFPGQFQLGNGNIPAGSSEKTLSIMVQPNTPPGDYTLHLLGQSQVPFSKEAMDNPPKTLVSIPSRPITLTVQAAETK